MQKLTYTLMYFSTADAIHHLSLLCKVPEGTLQYIVSETRKSLVTLYSKYVRRALSEEASIRMQAAFFKYYGLPLCIGVLDGTSIPIANPGAKYNGGKCFDRHMSYNLNMLGGVDYNGILIHTDVIHAGSCHDYNIFRRTALYEDALTGKTYGGVYYADPAMLYYANTQHVLSKFGKKELNDANMVFSQFKEQILGPVRDQALTLNRYISENSMMAALVPNKTTKTGTTI